MGTVQAGFLREEVEDGQGLGALVMADRGGRYTGGKSSYGVVVAAANETILLNPAPGNYLVVYWVAFVPDSDNATTNLVTIKFDGGTTLYVGYALAHWEPFEGAVDQNLIVDMEAADPVAITVHYEEITP